ncbi:MAG TPA: hypothetical protein VGX28_15935 [Frankiaceae bacterium]|nr:hypothetical protein [Frankiaceae bacterium]
MIDEDQRQQRTFKDRERETARLLSDEGCHVSARPEGQRPDADVRHPRRDHTTPTEFTTPEKSVAASLRDKSRDVSGSHAEYELLVDCRGRSHVTADTARRDLDNHVEGTQPFDRIRVVGDGFDWEYRRHPPKHEDKVRSYAEESQRLRDAEAERRKAQVRTNVDSARTRPPEYVASEIGERPPDGPAADRWDTTVARVETYRADHGVTDRASALGPRNTPDPVRNKDREDARLAIESYRARSREQERGR